MEAAVRADDVAAVGRVVEDTEKALHLAARHGAGAVFRHLLTTDPSLVATLATHALLYAALDGASVAVWATIIHHRPDAKNQRFGHAGTVVERCVRDGHADLLEYLLQHGARVESAGRPILLRAQVVGASDRVQAILRRYGATGNDEEE